MRYLGKSLIGAIAAITCMTATNVFAVHRIDVLGLYTDEAQLKDPAATYSSMIGYANRSYRNSGVDIELRLVHMEKNQLRWGQSYKWHRHICLKEKYEGC